jgi:hypothetical protein
LKDSIAGKAAGKLVKSFYHDALMEENLEPIITGMVDQSDELKTLSEELYTKLTEWKTVALNYKSRPDAYRIDVNLYKELETAHGNVYNTLDRLNEVYISICSKLGIPVPQQFLGTQRPSGTAPSITTGPTGGSGTQQQSTPTIPSQQPITSDEHVTPTAPTTTTRGKKK